PADAGLTVLAESAEAGLCLIEDRPHRAICMFNHAEYDAGTLDEEFRRDRRARKPIDIPRNYFPGDDPERAPVNVWRPYGQRLFANWLGEICRTAWPRMIDDELPTQGAPAATRIVRGSIKPRCGIATERSGLDVRRASSAWGAE